MSYARFGEGDVYVYRGAEGYVCCMCSMGDGGDAIFSTPEEMLEHLWEHIESGDVVPEGAFVRLEKERDWFNMTGKNWSDEL